MEILSLKEVKEITFVITTKGFSYNEPIPDFDTRYPNILESCLMTPFQTYAKRYLYPNFFARASILFYLMIKNHPFQNGNKRVAIITLLYFLHKNEKWLEVGMEEFYEFSVWVAASHAKAKSEAVNYIEKFIRIHVVPWVVKQ